jgi:hypothetical protein
MSTPTKRRFTAFAQDRVLATGDLEQVGRICKAAAEEGTANLIRIFDDQTGGRVDLELDGTLQEVADRIAWLQAYMAVEGQEGEAAPRGRGRPKLGVVSKEVTLLPRHWAWLDAQRGSASATLRRLVDEASKANQDTDKIRHAQDVTYRFLHDIAGNSAAFEETIRALYAGDRERFVIESEGLASDVRSYARVLGASAFPDGE